MKDWLIFVVVGLVFWGSFKAEPVTAGKQLFGKQDIREIGSVEKAISVKGMKGAATGPDQEVRLGTSLYPLHGDGIRDDKANIANILAKLGTSETTLVFPGGTFKIGGNLNIPGNFIVRLEKGAKLAPTTLVGLGTFSNGDAPGSGTISITKGSAIVNGSDTNFLSYKVGQYIVIKANRNTIRKKIRFIKGRTHLEVWGTLSTTLKGVSFNISTNTLRCTQNHSLELGDFIYLGGVCYCVVSVPSHTTVKVHRHPARTFSGQHWSYAVKVTIMGSLRAGLYQVFTGDGVVKFTKGTVPLVRPEWWGAKASGQVADAAINAVAFEKAMWSGAINCEPPIICTSGDYYLDRSIMFKPCAVLRGQGRTADGTNGTRLRISSSAAEAHIIEDIPDYPNNQRGEISYLSFFGNLPQYGHGISISNSRELHIHDCQFSQCFYGIYANGPASGGGIQIYRNHFYAIRNGIFFGVSDSWIQDNEIGFISASKEQLTYGIYCRGSSYNIITGNQIYADNPSTYDARGIFLEGSPANYLVNNNNINGCDTGIYLNGGTAISIKNNMIANNRLDGIYITSATNCNILGNIIRLNKRYGIALGTIRPVYAAGGIISCNHFDNNTKGHIWNKAISISSGQFPILVENNTGIDLENIQTLTLNSSSPSVLYGKRWKTANTSRTTISDFLYAALGKEIIVELADSNSTISCWGTDATFIYRYDSSKGHFSRNLSTISTWDYFPSAVVNDCIYWGRKLSDKEHEKFAGIRIYLDSKFTYPTKAFTWEYWNGSTWDQLSVTDNDVFTKEPGQYSVYFRPPVNWAKTTVNNQKAYWVRCRLSKVSGVGLGGANGTEKNSLCRIRLNDAKGGMGPITNEQIGTLHLIYDCVWKEVSRSVN
jgi:hypothetical protein